MTFYVHETSVVDDGAEIGDGSRIWHFSHISQGAKLGRNVSVGQNVFVGAKAQVGDDCKIQNNVSIYDNVILEDGVFCGPSVVFTNVYNPRSFVERKTEYLDTFVKRGATLGANCTVVCGIVIGEFSFVGAGSVVLSSVMPYALVVGNPAKQIGWMSEFGERMHFAERDVYVCPSTNAVYEIKDGVVFKR